MDACDFHTEVQCKELWVLEEAATVLVLRDCGENVGHAGDIHSLPLEQREAAEDKLAGRVHGELACSRLHKLLVRAEELLAALERRLLLGGENCQANVRLDPLASSQALCVVNVPGERGHAVLLGQAIVQRALRGQNGSVRTLVCDAVERERCRLMVLRNQGWHRQDCRPHPSTAALASQQPA
eukprot:scaffold13970_cov63-Phaeocystis_antarctica.AAC.2